VTFLDPEGLFLIVNTSEGIRLVARSTSSHVNVAQILSHFNGGGHERAASALIQSVGKSKKTATNLPLVNKQLLEFLGAEVQPAITARQLMSTQPHIISSEATTASALDKMQRLGYEGFPVVKDRKIIGLLTRRAVDRAHLHNLNLPASSLMEAGEVSVCPDDPVEVVQRKMADTGWGQIPVVDPESKNIIGIITRTRYPKNIKPPQE